MSWAKKNINVFRGCDAAILISVRDSENEYHEFEGTNKIYVYEKPDRKTAILEIDLTWDANYGIYTGEIDADDLDIAAYIYYYKWINSDDTKRPILTGLFTVSDEFTDNRAVVNISLSIDEGVIISGINSVYSDNYQHLEREIGGRKKWCIDRIITATGFAGIENTDWANIIAFDI